MRCENTEICTSRRPSSSLCGVTPAMRTSGGSVAWNWLSSSVHENVRRSISALASRAAACTAASFALIDRAADHLRLVAQVARLRFVLRDRLPRVAALRPAAADLEGVEQRQAERQRAPARRAPARTARSL